MRLGHVLWFVVALGLAPPSAADAQGTVRHHLDTSTDEDWQAWRGHDAAYLTARLGAPDRTTAAAWHYEYVTVGSFDGPYDIWTLTFVVRGGRVVRVRAVRGPSVGCDIYE